MKHSFRSKCPTTSALDIIGDKWSLVIIKLILFEGRMTFKDFTDSDEAIATNILSSRLKMLEEFKILYKVKLPSNKKTNIYILTKKGLDLAPTLLELTIWTKNHITEFHKDLNLTEDLNFAEQHKEEANHIIIDRYISNLKETYDIEWKDM